MIKSIADKETKKVWSRQFSKKLPAEIQKRAWAKLSAIHASSSLVSLKIPPSNHLEALKDNLKGFHSIRINDQWRIIFRFVQGDAWDVKITDYH